MCFVSIQHGYHSWLQPSRRGWVHQNQFLEVIAINDKDKTRVVCVFFRTIQECETSASEITAIVNNQRSFVHSFEETF